MKKIILLLFLSIQIQFQAQLNYHQKSKKEGANYFEIVQTAKKYFENAQNKKSEVTIKIKQQKKQFERWAYYWKDRINNDGTFPSETLGYFNAGIINSDGKIEKEDINLNKSSETWVNIGPQQNPETNGYPNYPQLGRLNAFLRIKHPSNRAQDVLFVGAPAGGVWKSTDNGATWSAKTDFVAGIGVTDIKTASTTTFSNYTTKPIYVSTGDYDGAHTKSIGILKSTDGGESFASTGLSYTISQGKSLGQMAVMDDNTVIVGGNQFIKRTTDGGITWNNIFDSGFNDTDFGRVAFSGNNIMYSGAYDVYFSSDLGTNWSTPITNEDQNKHAVTVGSDNEFYVQGQSGQVKKYNIGAGTFSDIGIVPGGYESQDGYNQTLIVKDGLIVTGEFNGQSSSDNGASWYRSLNGYFQNDEGGPQEDHGTYIHSDHHAMGLLDGQYEFWSVNDGGLSFITYNSLNDNVPAIEYKSNGVINSQLYDVAITPNLNTGHYIMANQDNDGYSREMHNGLMQWIGASAGDGVCAVINYNNNSIRYLGGQKGGLRKTGNGFSGQYQGESFGQINGAAFVWPLEIHTTNPTILYAGGDDLYKLTDTDANTNLNTVVTNAVNLNSGAGQIEKIATHGSGIAVIGENSAKYSKNDGSTWSTVANPNGVTINSVDFNQTDMTIVYVTVSGYTDGSKVFKSTDSGTTWMNISTGLPNIVMKEIVLRQNEATEILFAATELGVYFKYGNQDWAKLGQSLPNVIVNDIDINYIDNKLVAATFGRGLWHINITNNSLSTNDINVEENLFKVFPNPINDGYFNYNLDEKYANLNYKIFNVLGGVVAEGKFSSAKGTVNVSALNNGIYMIKAYKEGFSIPAIKLLVNNK